jgi:predicted anti-sigma-YlaC factor YlaD
VQLHTLISLGVAVAVAGAAVKFGDYSARRIGAAVLVAWLGSQLLDSSNAYKTDLAMLALDAATLVYFVWISIRSRRLWTVIASAFMAIIVASHVATTIDLRVTIDTFKVSMAIWSYGILLCLVFGTWAGWRERRRAAASQDRP